MPRGSKKNDAREPLGRVPASRLPEVLTMALRALQNNSDRCMAKDCNHGYREAHGIVRVNSCTEYLKQALVCGDDQAETFNAWLARLGVRTTIGRGLGRFEHAVLLTVTAIAPPMIASAPAITPQGAGRQHNMTDAKRLEEAWGIIQSQQQRIAELEAEVARLRGKK